MECHGVALGRESQPAVSGLGKQGADMRHGTAKSSNIHGRITPNEPSTAGALMEAHACSRLRQPGRRHRRSRVVRTFAPGQSRVRDPKHFDARRQPSDPAGASWPSARLSAAVVRWVACNTGATSGLLGREYQTRTGDQRCGQVTTYYFWFSEESFAA